MRFTFQEEKNRGSRDGNRNTLIREKDGKTAFTSVPQVKSKFGEIQTAQVQTKIMLPRRQKGLTRSRLRDSMCWFFRLMLGERHK